MMNKLKELSQEELKELLEDPEKLSALTNDLPEIQNLQLEREMALASNRSLAEKNLEFEPHLEQGKSQLSERYLQLQILSSTCQEHKEKLEKLATSYKPDQLLSRLQSECENSDTVSEATAEAFLAGEVPLESFLEEFQCKRRWAHQSRVQLEKLQELLTQTTNEAGIPSNQINPPPEPNTIQATPSPPQRPPAFPLPYGSVPGSPGQKLVSGPSASGQLPPVAYPQAPNTAPLPYPMPYSAAPSFPSVPQSFNTPPQQPSFMPPYPIPGQPQFPGSAFPSNPPYPVQPPAPGSIGPGQLPYPSYPSGSFFPSPQPFSSQSPTAMPVYRPGYNIPRPYS